MDTKDQSKQSLTRTFDTELGVLTYAELSDAIAPYLVSLLDDCVAGKFSQVPFSTDLILSFHKRIIGKVIPDIAGKWRTVAVQVSSYIPPEYYLVPSLMLDYAANIQTRLDNADSLDLQLELLTYAEGEFLHIHPFQDFNGRTIRVLLTELLIRLNLPVIDVSVERNTERFETYRNALAEYDNGRREALSDFWIERLST